MNQLRKADMVLMLVSPDFLASEFCRRVEILEAFRRFEHEQTQVIPVILRQCQWKRTALAELQVLPQDGQPLNSLPDADAAWSTIVDELVEAAKRHQDRPRLSSTENDKGPGVTALKCEPEMSDLLPPEIVRLQDNLPEVRKRIDKVADYKQLHDGLHGIQQQCLRMIVREMQREGELDTISRQNLDECARIWKDCLSDLESLFQRPTLMERGDWLVPLRDLCDDFAEALRHSDRTHVARIAEGLQSVLGNRMSIVDNLLHEAARELDLARVVSTLQTVRTWASGAGWAGPRISRVNELEAKLRSLQVDFERLVQEHGNWQNIEDLLRTVEGETARVPQKLAQNWPLLSKYFTRLRDLGALAGDMGESVDVLNAAVAQRDEPRINERFPQCRSLVGQRFYRIDQRLLRLCEDLRLAGEPLRYVLADTVIL